MWPREPAKPPIALSRPRTGRARSIRAHSFARRRHSADAKAKTGRGRGGGPSTACVGWSTESRLRPRRSEAMTDPRRLIDELRLEPQPEGGWYRETWRADSPPGGRAPATAILFLLEHRQRSRWHRVD